MFMSAIYVLCMLFSKAKNQNAANQWHKV